MSETFGGNTGNNNNESSESKETQDSSRSNQRITTMSEERSTSTNNDAVASNSHNIIPLLDLNSDPVESQTRPAVPEIRRRIEIDLNKDPPPDDHDDHDHSDSFLQDQSQACPQNVSSDTSKPGQRSHINPETLRRVVTNVFNESMRCYCRNPNCAKLYFESFCGESCQCKGCDIRKIFESRVDQQAQMFKAFSNPTDFQTSVAPTRTENENQRRRGCVCKEKQCYQRLCRCVQARVGCTSACKCVDCRNTFGRRTDSSSSTSSSSNQPHDTIR